MSRLVLGLASSAQAQGPAAVGTHAIAGSTDGLEVEVRVDEDAGVGSDTAELATHVVHGALAALRTQQQLAKRHLVAQPSIRRLTLLAGPAFYETTLTAARAALAP